MAMSSEYARGTLWPSWAWALPKTLDRSSTKYTPTPKRPGAPSAKCTMAAAPSFATHSASFGEMPCQSRHSFRSRSRVGIGITCPAASTSPWTAANARQLSGWPSSSWACWQRRGCHSEESLEPGSASEGVPGGLSGRLRFQAFLRPLYLFQSADNSNRLARRTVSVTPGFEFAASTSLCSIPRAPRPSSNWSPKKTLSGSLWAFRQYTGCCIKYGCDTSALRLASSVVSYARE
mmetsp:Transcript_24326/g.69348  ORF Transcript_24326/g.69348 Transcript_24326/m.69348 type:complete len:234 (-) Transcript_24326:593-1294(-)